MAFFGLFGKGGKRYGGDLVGRNITISGKKIIVDGVVVTDEAEGVVELRIIGADSKLDSIEASCAVHVTGNVVGTIKAGMEVRCGNVTGDVNAGMDVACGDVGGDVDTNMGLTCGTIGGRADAGMSIDCTGDIKGNAKAGMSIKARTVASKDSPV